MEFLRESDKVKRARDYVAGLVPGGQPEVAVILGSGLGAFADTLTEVGVRIPYKEIPGFPVSSVSGHAGQLVCGRLGIHNVVVMQGRVHHYEGFSLREVVFPTRVLVALGAKTVICTNAAGGVNPLFNVGDLMLITDHVNMLGKSPCHGENDPALGTRFFDMGDAYNSGLRKRILEASYSMKIQTGVYACMPGPQYETPAEVRMLRTLGVDAVGMSTVPEVIAARHMGVKCVGISCITNMAAGVVAGARLSHEEVKETADRVAAKFVELLTLTVSTIPHVNVT